MPKKKPILRPIERDIIKLLDKRLEPLSVNEVAEELGISYVTANKYLKELAKKKILEEVDGK